MNLEKQEFDAELRQVPGINGAYICLPFDAKEIYGRRHMIRIRATIDGVLYRGSLVDMGMGTMLGVTQEIRKKIGKNPGDTVRITLEPDTEERTVEIPPDVVALFDRLPEAFAWFRTLSFTNRKEYIRWITDAKKEETRKNRLDQMAVKLMEKKKNPSGK